MAPESAVELESLFESELEGVDEPESEDLDSELDEPDELSDFSLLRRDDDRLSVL